MSLNKVMAIGHLGSKPELRTLADGNAVANFSVAVNERWTDKQGQKQERTEWIKVSVWGKQAENCSKYLDKGRQVYVEGRLQTRSWEKDGQKHYTTEVKADNVQFLGGGGSTAPAQGTAPAGAPAPQQADPHYMNDDIPF